MAHESASGLAVEMVWIHDAKQILCMADEQKAERIVMESCGKDRLGG